MIKKLHVLHLLWHTLMTGGCVTRKSLLLPMMITSHHQKVNFRRRWHPFSKRVSSLLLLQEDIHEEVSCFHFWRIMILDSVGQEVPGSESHYDRSSTMTKQGNLSNFGRHRHSFNQEYGQSQTYNPYTMTGVSTVRRALRSKHNSPSSKDIDGRMFVTSQLDFGQNDSNFIYSNPDDHHYATLRNNRGHRSRHQSDSMAHDYFHQSSSSTVNRREPSSSSSRSRSNSRHLLDSHLDRRPSMDAALSIFQPPAEYASPSSHNHARHSDHSHHVSRTQHSSREPPSNTALLSKSGEQIISASHYSSVVNSSSPRNSRSNDGHHSHARNKSLTRRMTTSSLLSPSILHGSSFHAFHDLDGLLDTNVINKSSPQYSSLSQTHLPVYASNSTSVAGSLMMLLPDPPEETNYSAAMNHHLYSSNIFQGNSRSSNSKSNPYLLSDGFEADENGVIYSQVSHSNHRSNVRHNSRSNGDHHGSRSRSREKQLEINQAMPSMSTMYSTVQRRPSRKKTMAQASMTRHQNMMDPRSVYGYVGPSVEKDNYYYHPRNIANIAPTVSSTAFTKSCQNIANAGLSVVTSIPSLNPPMSSYYANSKMNPISVPVVVSANNATANKSSQYSKQHHNSSSSSTTSGDNYYRGQSQSQANLIPSSNEVIPTTTLSKVASPSSASTDSSSVSSSSGLKSNATATTPMFSSQSSTSTPPANPGHHRQNNTNNSSTVVEISAGIHSSSHSKNYQNNGNKTHHPILALTSGIGRTDRSLENSDEHLLLQDVHRPLAETSDDDQLSDHQLDGLEIENPDDDVEAHIQSMNGFSGHSSKSDHSHRSHHHHRRRHRSRKTSRDINCCLKYTLFGVNTIAWLMGFLVMMIGFWAWNEKDYLSNLTNIPLITLDPAFALIVLGLVSFVIAFVGCMGALRENTCLLATYSVFLIGLLVLELGLSVLAFIMKDWVSQEIVITVVPLSHEMYSRCGVVTNRFDLKHLRRCKPLSSIIETTLIDRISSIGSKNRG